MGKNESNIRAEHVPGPPIVDSLVGGGTGYEKVTITMNGKKYIGCASNTSEARKIAEEKAALDGAHDDD
jgi:hypothetical protein